MSGDATRGDLVGCDAAVAQLAAFDQVIDVRSPSEFAADHLPGAINCPVLDDAQRALVGTLHRQESAFAARRLGAALVARNIATHLEERFADRPPGWKPLVYCWRGGERSGAMAHVLARVGWRVRRLDGGYKAFRRLVIDALGTLPARCTLRVITGPTGSGKSRLLAQLALAGAQVLDLEALARHRGSVLGGLPRCPQPGQCAFETALWDALRGVDPQRPLFVEAESRRIGALRLPDALIDAMRAAPCVPLALATPQRVALLRAEYSHLEGPADRATLLLQLERLVALHGRECIGAWQEHVRAGRWDELVERLLREHYDPSYARSITRDYPRSAGVAPHELADASEASYARAARALLDRAG